MATHSRILCVCVCVCKCVLIYLFLIEGQLLYDFALVSTRHQHESAIG